MLPIEGQINSAANFQAEDFESKNATDLDYLANPTNPNYGLNKEIKVQLRRGKQGKLEYFSNN